MNQILQEICIKARAAATDMASVGTPSKNAALVRMAEEFVRRSADIISANKRDISAAERNGISGAMLQRLMLDEKKIAQMAEGIRQLSELPDPVGEVSEMVKRPNGLLIGKKRVPLGVIGIIYEARPNVTADAAALCLKAGNTVILRGGSEAISSNKILVDIMRGAIASEGLPEDAICLIEDTGREMANELMRMNGYIDVLIPRGGAGLIKSVVENARVPVIETGTGNCHIYVDGDADLSMAEEIVINAKTSYVSVCNAAEKLLIDEKTAAQAVPLLCNALKQKGVEIRGCEGVIKLFPEAIPLTHEDLYTEFLDYIIGVKIVSGIDGAIEHINRYGTKHSESIITSSYDKAMKFHERVDSAAVYVNASTRFTDGFEFGLGAEIGISTQKLHARGPMGLHELTTIKYVIFGQGQIR